MHPTTNPNEFRRTSIKRLTLVIDRVVEDLETLESPSPKNINKQMTQTFHQLGTITEKIKKQDLNPQNFQANHRYQISKDKIKSYVADKYQSSGVKDSKRLVEILQNRPLTTFYKQSQKLLFDSIGQVEDLIKQNKRKFGEFWDAPRPSQSVKLPEISPIFSIKDKEKPPRNERLSKLITKLMVKNLGIKNKEEPILNSTRISSLSPRDKLKNVMYTFQPKKLNDEIVFDDEEYFAPEYTKYISDVRNSIKIQKYIGQNTGKRRKISHQQAKLSKLSRV